MQPYSYKDSGIQWLGDIPEHWQVAKIKNEFRVIPSNVDKRTQDNETHVKLCNYVDVYYNDFITNNIDFMEATATDHEIGKFLLHKDDVLITKDSEDPLDIAVPTLVKETQEDLLCGYHLSMLRTSRKQINGSFLFWSLRNEAIASQLHREACGVTRWAIASRHIKNSTIAFPPLREQEAIAAYLEQACARIDRVIAIKEEQLGTIEGYLSELIIKCVTQGLSDDVELKPVDSDWVNGIPKHWEEKKVKRICNVFRGKFTHRPRNDPEYYDGEYPFIQTGSVSQANKYITEYSQTLNELGLSVSELFPAGTLAMTIAANIGDVAILTFDACFPDSIVGFRPSHKVDLEFLFYSFKGLKQDFLSTAIITTQMNLNIARIGAVNCYVPPIEEQREIVAYLNIQSKKVDDLKLIIRKQIDTLKSYRKSLIHECVTGKKQVAEMVQPQKQPLNA